MPVHRVPLARSRLDSRLRRLSSDPMRAGHPSKASAIEMGPEHVPRGVPIPDHPLRGLPHTGLETMTTSPRPPSLRVAFASRFRAWRVPVEPLRDREGRPTPSKSTFAIARERSLYPDPQRSGTLHVAGWRSREMEPSKFRSAAQGPLRVPSREGKRASPRPKCLSSVDAPVGAERRRASPPGFGAFASVPNTRF